MPKPPSSHQQRAFLCQRRKIKWRARYQNYKGTFLYKIIFSHLFSVPEKRCSLELFAQFGGGGDRGEWKKCNCSSSWAHSHSRKATWHEMSHSHTRGAGADRSRALASTFSRQLNKETSHTAMDDGARRISTIFYYIYIFTSLRDQRYDGSIGSAHLVTNQKWICSLRTFD